MVVRAVLINTTDALGHHGCTLVNRQLEEIARSAQIELVARLPLHSNWSSIAPNSFDCVIVNGEGTLHSDSKGAKRIAQVPTWSKQRSVPAFLINSIFQGNSLEIVKSIAEFQGIWVRDERSQQQLISSGIETSYVPDLTLTWSPQFLQHEQNTIVIQDSTIRSMRQKLYNLSKCLNAYYLPITARPSSAISGKNFIRRSKFFIKTRFPFIITSDFERTRYTNAVPEFDEFIKTLSKASLIITGRFHGIALAICLRIPFLALSSNSHKMEALLEKLEMPHRLVGRIEEVQQVLKSGRLNIFSEKELIAIELMQSDAKMRSIAMFHNIFDSVKSNSRI